MCVVLSRLGQQACVDASEFDAVRLVGKNVKHPTDADWVKIELEMVFDPIAEIHPFRRSNDNHV